jgi:hypothetical protein
LMPATGGMAQEERALSACHHRPGENVGRLAATMRL